ncbi:MULTISPECIES: hypothetical protein [Xanthomonas]|uniref:hypothetical protein n=1 Tax=Xanthomonas TaxID=338 RepID=UPI000F8F1EAA|nr:MULTISPECIES: hypothetical protein [Xanthomonas]MBG3852377.1 hypothetical protein [Xanthomonas hortorum pv. carotae]UTS72957.1 hypothetical protein NMB96_21445 [Xanthomonas hortorum]
MEKDEFLAGSKVAAKILFDAIKHQRQSSQFKALTSLCQPKICLKDFNSSGSEYVACEMLAGSLIVLAHKIIDLHGASPVKGTGALHFESEINRLIHDYPGARIKKKFELPLKFCVGREVGHLPLGVIVHGARNQYCHFGESRRLDPINELVFNHLQQLYADAEWLNFDAKAGGRILALTATSTLYWTADENDGGVGFERFCVDMSDVIGQAY